MHTPPAELELGPNVTLLERDGRRFYLVGTAHISEKSVREVRDTIEKIRPDTVAVELCETRYQAIMDESRWRKLDIFQVIKQGKVLFVLANLALAAYQRRMGEKLGVKPGAEMLEAVHVAKEVGAELVLADRDIQATLKRTWANLGFFTKVKLLSSFDGKSEELTEEQIEKLKDRDTLSETMQAFAQEVPQIQKPLIDERDQYLMSAVEDAPGQTVVAVVGAGHVPGMKRYLGQKIDRAALSVIPPPGKLGAVLKWLIPALIIAAFWWGWQKNDGANFTHMLLAWILPTGLLSALGTALVLGKPLSILSAALAAPITTLHPLIGAGMVVGLVEAWLRRPTVEDAMKVREVNTIRQAFGNAFVRVLLVFVGSSLGAAIGAWVGGFLVATYL
jgi:pheromone shutdown-related protein TraB